MSRHQPSRQRSVRTAARLLQRADILAGRGRLDEALEACRQALDAEPGLVEVHRRIGALSILSRRHQVAFDALEIALALEPLDTAALCNIAAALRELGRPDEARVRLEQALWIDPGLPSAWFNLGVVHADTGRWQDAAACYRRTLRSVPRHEKAAAGLALALLGLGQPAEAVAVARQALSWAPEAAQLHSCLAQALLASGELAEGWREYEWRWQIPELAANRRHADRPPWHGQPLDGRGLLLHAEQGLGDNLQMCRYLPLIRGAGHIVLEVQASLVRLLRTLPHPDGTRVEVVERGGALPAFDLQCPMMSLPLACGTACPADVPAAMPYLSSTPEDAAAWRHRLRDVPGLKVGLCWASGRSPERVNRILHARKSIPLAALAPLGTVPGCSFVSLQKGEAAAELGTPPADLRVLDLSAAIADFADTAALIGNLDLVLTVDTAVAHLAGALGAPVWLLNRADADWRWSPAQEQAPWYPTLRQFRQQLPGDWAGVVLQVGKALRRRIASP